VERRNAVSDQDGLHNVLTTPEFQAVLYGAIERKFAELIEPDLKELIRRYVSQADHVTPSSVNVRAAANGGPTKLVERNDYRIEVWVYNNGNAPIYIGGRQVTVGSPNDPNGGIPVQPAGEKFIRGIGEWWAVSAIDGQDVRVLDMVAGIAR
jgi:hypothetical protein